MSIIVYMYYLLICNKLLHFETKKFYKLYVPYFCQWMNPFSEFSLFQ
jgi:hypothetical protein